MCNNSVRGVCGGSLWFFCSPLTVVCSYLLVFCIVFNIFIFLFHCSSIVSCYNLTCFCSTGKLCMCFGQMFILLVLCKFCSQKKFVNNGWFTLFSIYIFKHVEGDIKHNRRRWHVLVWYLENACHLIVK